MCYEKQIAETKKSKSLFLQSHVQYNNYLAGFGARRLWNKTNSATRSAAAKEKRFGTGVH